MPETVFRIAMLSDIDALVELRMAFLCEVAGAGADDTDLRRALRDYFSGALGQREFIAWLAEADGAVIAASGMVIHQHPPSPANRSGREAYIMNMYTLPAHRGGGIATALLAKLLDHARQQRCGRAVLHALPKGRSIYKSAGFVATESEMRLDLSS